MIHHVAVYGGPAVVLVDGSDDPVPVTVWLMSTDTASPISRWHGRLEPKSPGALWDAHMATRAQLVIAGQSNEIRITVYAHTGPCEFEGLGPPPFL
jgi:hypothetical protein